MGITLNWHDDMQTILYEKFTDPWTWADLWQVRPQYKQMAESALNTFTLLADLSESVVLPGGTLTEIHKIAKYMPEKQTMIFIVGGNPYIHTLLTLTRRFVPQMHRHYATAPTLAIAFEQIAYRQARR